MDAKKQRIRWDMPIRLIQAPITGEFWGLSWIEERSGMLITRVIQLTERKRKGRR